jgi:site-specific DNA-adenine methylase
MPFIPLKPYPLKTLGGKAQLIEQLIKIIDNCIETYNLVGVIDACMGGNRIFLTHHPEQELELKIANEKDLGMVNFFHCLKDPYLTDQLIDEIWLLSDLYTNEKDFNDARWIRRDSATPMVISAALTYILTEFSRAANKKTFCETNANNGVDPKSLDKFLHLEALLEDVEIRHGDCLDITKEFAHREDILTFLDVPYVEDDSETGKAKATQGYEDKFTPEDQEELIDIMISSSNKTCICGYENKTYKRLEQNGYNKYFVGLVNVSSSSTGRKRKEYIWCNFEIDDDLLPVETPDEDF